jgi:hypothetical protein
MNRIDINTDLLDDPNMMGGDKFIKKSPKIKSNISYFNSNDIDMINAFDLEDEIKSNVSSLVKVSNIKPKTFTQSKSNQTSSNNQTTLNTSVPKTNNVQTNTVTTTNVRGGSTKVDMENAGRNQSEKVEIKDKDINTSIDKTKDKIVSDEKSGNSESKEKNNEIKNEDENKKILGMKPILFYSLLTILGIGIGLYSYNKFKTN